MYQVNLFQKNDKRVVLHHPNSTVNMIQRAELEESLDAYPVLTIDIATVTDLNIEEFSDLIEVVEVDSSITRFIGRVASKEKDMDSKGIFTYSIDVEGLVALLHDVVIRSYIKDSVSLKTAISYIINEYNKKANSRYTLVLKECVDKNIEVEWEYEDGYECFKQAIGEANVEFEAIYDNSNHTVNIYIKEKIGANNVGKIDLGVNMQNVSVRVDKQEFATRVIPIGSIINEKDAPEGARPKRYTVESVNNGLDYLVDKELEKQLGYSIEKVVENNDIENSAKLKKWGQKELKRLSTVDISITANYVDLVFMGLAKNRISIGNNVNIYNPILYINTISRVISLRTDLLNPHNPFVELASRRKGLSDKFLQDTKRR